MLGTFLFEPKFRSYFCFTVGPLNFSDFANQSKLHLLPLCLSASAPPGLSAAARRRGRPQATSCLARRLTWHPREPLDPPPLALEPPPLATPPQPSSAAATSPSPWPAQRNAPDPQLARASAPRAPPQCIPLTPSPLPSPEPPEHRSRPTRAPTSSKLTVDQPL